MEHVLKIEVNGKHLTFYPNAKVKMIRKSPLFLNEADPGSRIYTFTIPAEPNAEILDYANLLFNNKKIATLDCNVYLKGNFYKKAKLDIVGFTKETFDIRVRFDKPYFVEAAERKLRSFEYNNETPFRFLELERNDYVFNFSFINTPPTANFTLEIQYEVPLDNFTTTSAFFNYETGNPETITEFITKIADYFTSRLSTEGVYCKVLSATQLQFVTPYNNSGLVGLTFIRNTACALQLNAPTAPGVVTNYESNWQESLQLANDTVNNPENYDFVFFPFHAPKGNDSPAYRATVNEYNPDTLSGGFMSPIFTRDFYRYKGLVPFPYLYKVFEYIHKELKINVEDEFFDDELKTLVYFNNTVFNHTYIPDTIPSGAVTYHLSLINISSFKYANIVPDITYKEFVYDLANMFCLVFDYESNDEKVRVIPRKKILQSDQVNNLTSKLIFDYVGNYEGTIYSLKYTWPSDETLVETRILPILNLTTNPDIDIEASLPATATAIKKSITRAYKENWRYKLVVDQLSNRSWNFFDEHLENYVVNLSNTDITTGLSTLFLHVGNYDLRNPIRQFLFKALLPFTESPINIQTEEVNSYSQRILFYRGLIDIEIEAHTISGDYINPTPEYRPGKYPFGTYHNYDVNYNKIGNYSLAWNAPDGLVEVWWKQWIDFLNSTYPVKLQFDFSASEFMQLDMLEKIQVGNQHFLIDEMEVELSNEISLVDVKAYPIKTGE